MIPRMATNREKIICLIIDFQSNFKKDADNRYNNFKGNTNDIYRFRLELYDLILSYISGFSILLNLYCYNENTKNQIIEDISLNLRQIANEMVERISKDVIKNNY